VTSESEGGHKIPAANIGDADLAALARTNPEAAREIARLEALMHRGEETKEEFLRLCRLLFDVRSIAASEILLRRNLDYYGGRTLYTELFGTTKPDEFEAAIEAFQTQFLLELTARRDTDFLVAHFISEGGPVRSDAFELLSNPCEIKIGYIQQEIIEADINLLDPGREIFQADECLLLFFTNGVWEIAEPLGS
jgi:hypothetical protein